MIRQAISCDICGTDKQQTNHWFVAYEQSGELRISGWNTQSRLRSGAKHLCGQICLHKLVDEFMAKTIAVRMPTGAEKPESETKPPIAAARPAVPAAKIDTSLTVVVAHPLPVAVPAEGQPRRRLRVLRAARQAGPCGCCARLAPPSTAAPGAPRHGSENASANSASPVAARSRRQPIRPRMSS